MRRLGAVYAWVRDPHPVVLDVLLALGCALLGVLTELNPQVETVQGYRDGNALSVGLTLCATLPLVWRRRHPVLVLLVVVAAALTHAVMVFGGAGPLLGLLVSLYSVASYGSALAARVGLAAVLVFHPLVVLHDPKDLGWGDFILGAAMLTAAWVFGDSRRVRRMHLATIEDRAARLERERDEQARIAARDERTRIAREMHDIVAHNVSVMVVQAGAARRMVARDPGAAAEAAGEVEATGRAALRDMRRVLGVLRSDDETARPLDGEAVALAPQPDLSDVPTLVSQCREAGLDVTVQCDGEVRPLPSGVELAAYRIVQEALTNTMKHAGPARAVVRIVYGHDDLTVVVGDNGRGPSFEPATGGHGLPGMRERVAVYGGDLDAGARPGGGFRVRARLPLERSAARSRCRS
jgi:signal transduction histidine kinase